VIYLVSNRSSMCSRFEASQNYWTAYLRSMYMGIYALVTEAKTLVKRMSGDYRFNNSPTHH